MRLAAKSLGRDYNLLPRKAIPIRAYKRRETVIPKWLRMLKELVCILFYFAAKATFRSEISILEYHSVGTNRSHYSVNPKDFYEQMDYIRERYRVVSLDDIREHIEGKKDLPRKAVAITFDDGYLDNYLNAYPYLRKYGFQAMVFITTGYVQKNMDLDGELLPMLTWNMIREMSDAKIEFGAHTVSHPDLTEIDADQANIEIATSRKELEKRVGEKVNYFSYPFGAHNSRVVELVKHLNFKGAVTSGVAGVISKGADGFVLNRVQIDRLTSFITFKTHLTAAATWERVIEQTLKAALGKSLLMSMIGQREKTN